MLLHTHPTFFLKFYIFQTMHNLHLWEKILEKKCNLLLFFFKRKIPLIYKYKHNNNFSDKWIIYIYIYIYVYEDH